MIHWQEGFCKALGYQGLWFVKYDLHDGRYCKKEMACGCMKGDCAKDCKVFDVAPEMIPVEDEWRLKDE